MNVQVVCLGSLVLCFGWLQPTTVAEEPSAKPGLCPRLEMARGVCAEFCSNDHNCPRNEKCCSNGCGHQCVAPYIAKPGVCPDVKNAIGVCAEFCSDDRNCPRDEKCCSNGCGHHCVAPYSAKPGVCPDVKNAIGVCAEFCSDDRNCPRDEKCCSNGCGHQCVAPYMVKTSRIIIHDSWRRGTPKSGHRKF